MPAAGTLKRVVIGSSSSPRATCNGLCAHAAHGTFARAWPICSPFQDREVGDGAKIHVEDGAADSVPAWRDAIGKQTRPMCDVDDRVGGECQRDDRQSLT